MFYNKYLNNNKILFTYKELINNDIQKAFDYYIHLPVFFKQNFLFSRFKCKHEITLLKNRTWLMHLNNRKFLLNKIINLGLIIEFLIDNELQEIADNIISRLKKIWVNSMYEKFIFFMNEYRTAYKLKNIKNKQTGKIETVKDYDVQKRMKFETAFNHIKWEVLEVFNQPSEAFTLRWEKDPYLYYLYRFELENIDVENILNLFIYEDSLIKISDYFVFYIEKKESYSITYHYGFNEILFMIEKFGNKKKSAGENR